jgi:hypothetical protein
VTDGEALESIHQTPTEHQKLKAIVAAILFAGGTSQYKTPEKAVEAAQEFVNEAAK